METTSLTFARPEWFAALVVVPLLGALLVWSWWRGGQLVGRLVAARLRARLAGSASGVLRVLRGVLVLAALAMAVVAMTRPQLGFVEREITQRGRDIVLAVDTSRSMLATDVQPSRLARAKLFARDVVELGGGDRVGVIAFAGSAFLQAPLTLDRTAVLNSIDELDTEIIPKGGTNIAEAIRLAEKAFGKAEGQTRALVIVTDGEELDADGIAAARNAGAQGVRIFTVGVGSAEGSLIPLREGGKQDFVRDAQGRPVNSRLDASRLAEIASATGGFYTPLGPDAARQVFERGILPLETAERGVMASRLPIERYHWPLGAAAVLVAVWMLLGERRFRVRVAAFFLACASAQASDGMRAYLEGNYTKALEDFGRELAASTESAERQFNAGTAAYKVGDFPKAIDLFAKSIASKTDNKQLPIDATYNLGNALARRGEAATDTEAKRADFTDAIKHYDSVLEQQPDHTNAKENREIVRKLIEELKKQDQQKQDQQKQDQQKQDQQKQDQQKQDQQKQDQQKQDQQKQDQQKQDQQKQDQQKQDQQKQDQQQQDQQQQDQQQQDQQQQDQQQQDQQQQDQQQQDQQQQDQQRPGARQSQQPGEQPQATPEPKKEGDLRAAQPEHGQEEALQPVEEKDGEMSAAQARSLLNSLRNEEERVRLLQPPQEQKTLRDW